MENKKFLCILTDANSAITTLISQYFYCLRIKWSFEPESNNC